MVVKGVFGVGAGVISDFFVEFLNVPVLNENGMFGNTKQSNYEVIVYAITGGGATAGIIDLFSNSRPLGFSKDFMPYFIGFGIGTGLYENLIANALGIRNFNPYEFIYNAIPSVPLL
jgi:hypothetical protein